MKKILFLCLIIFLCTPIPINAIDVIENDGIYHITLDANRKTAKKLKFVATDELMTVKEFHQKSGAILTVNGGFFDPRNQKTVSYIITDGQIAADPLFNENLFKDLTLRKNMDKILNRSEFRVLECFNGYRFEIAQHKQDVDFECQLVNSIQGGPLIYPKLQLEEEFFILRNEEGNIIRQSASVLLRAPRTIIGIKNKEIHILIFTDKHPATLEEVSDYCKNLELDRAMALDGGGSTSMNYLDKIDVISTPEAGQGRAVKSFIIYKK